MTLGIGAGGGRAVSIGGERRASSGGLGTNTGD